MSSHWDVIVVGAGVIGSAIGWELARRGARIVILDARGAGCGATQASAGVLAPYIEAPGGGALHDLSVRSLALFDTFIENLTDDTGWPLEYRRCGTLEIAADQAAEVRLTQLAAWARAAGVEARWMDAAGLAAAEPGLAPAFGGLLVPTHGYVAVPRLIASLTEAAASRRAATVIARVERLENTGTGVVVTSLAGTHQAPVAVIAAGSWSSELTVSHIGAAIRNRPGPPVKPIRGQLLRLRWNGPALSRVLWGEGCYVVPWTDGTVLIGATVEDVGFDERTTADGVRSLLEAACDLLPAARDATFLEARVGLRPATPDGLPIIGNREDSPSIVYATGHYRNGILLAPLTAQLVADLVLDHRSDPALALTAPARFDSV